MQGRVCKRWLGLLPLVAVLTSCASYTHQSGTNQAGDAIADVYVQSSIYAFEADPSVSPALLAFSVGADGKLTPAPSLQTSEVLMVGRSGMLFTYDPASQAIHQYAIGQDGSLSGPRSTLDPTRYDNTACGPPTGYGMLDPSGTYLTVELGTFDQGCNVWQTYRLQGDGSYQFLGQDSSGQWLIFKGQVLMGWPGFSGMSNDGQYAYAMEEVESDTSLAAMKRDASGVMRIWQGFNWPYDPQWRWQPGGLLMDVNDHVVLPMLGQTNATWNQMWLASFSIDPGTGSLQPISSYENMPKSSSPWGARVAFSPQGDTLAVAGRDGSLQLFEFQNAGPATPAGTVQLPNGQWPNTMVWDTRHHLYILTQTSPNAPAVARFSLHVFTAANGQLTAAPGSPWNVPNGNAMVLVPKG